MRARGFHPMPKQVATISLVAGLCVMAFGVVLAFVEPPSADTPSPVSQEPVATLEPSEEAPIDSRSDITGTVLSADGDELADVEVELLPLFGKPVKQETTTDEAGRFAFETVKLDLGSPYVVEAIYDGTRFATRTIRVPRGTDPKLEIRVAETTKSDDDLVVEVETLTIAGDDAALQAVHAVKIRNDSDQAYVGKTTLPLLRGAASIQEGTGLDRRLLSLEHGAMISSAPLLPGTTELTYTYVTQMSKDGIAFTRTPQLPTERYELLVTGDLEVSDLETIDRGDNAKIGDRTYARTVATDVAAGDEIRARIVVDAGPDLVRVGAPVAAVVIAVLVIAIGLLRRRRKPPPAAPAPVEHTPAST